MINSHQFEKMDQSVVAPIIYASEPHCTTNWGRIITSEIKQELRQLLSEFNTFLEIKRSPYYRIDAYFNDYQLWILEINAAFVDGWGTALNLARASGIAIAPHKLIFPSLFATTDESYRPELELFLQELAILGIDWCEMREWNGEVSKPIYVYGRVASKDCSNVLPYDGIHLDNKLNLGRFSRKWKGDLVKIPHHYIGSLEEWEDIPWEAVLKFCDKGGEECRKARRSVFIGKPVGKAPFLKKCYREEKLLAQDFVNPYKSITLNQQLVILAIGDEPITGYIQWSRDKIINDNSMHGPLLFL